MKKFFIDNGQLLTVFMSCIFIFFADNLPEFSNAYLTFITYCIILLIPNMINRSDFKKYFLDFLVVFLGSSHPLELTIT